MPPRWLVGGLVLVLAISLDAQPAGQCAVCHGHGCHDHHDHDHGHSTRKHGGVGGGASPPAGRHRAVFRSLGDEEEAEVMQSSYELFVSLDADGDGYLTADELPPHLHHLLGFDKDGDRRISVPEYLGGIKNVQLEKSLDQQCRDEYGSHAEFDRGAGACRCKSGYVVQGGKCVRDVLGVGGQEEPTASLLDAGAVVELSDATFSQMLKDGGWWVILFHRPGRNKQRPRAFEQAALEYAQAAVVADYKLAKKSLPPQTGMTLQFGSVNVEQFGSVAKKEGIRSLPAIRMYHNGLLVKEHFGPHSVADIVDFAAAGQMGKRGRSGRTDAAKSLDGKCKVQYGSGSEFDGEGCTCRPGFKNVGGKCVPVEKPTFKARAPTKKRSYKDASVFAGAMGLDAASAAWRKQSEKTVERGQRAQRGMESELEASNRMCEQSFGAGAVFDGEMCTCKSGYVNENGRCKRVGL